MKCPKCCWHDLYKICPICDHQIPEERNYIKRAFFGATIVVTTFYSPSTEESEEED